jgi:nucleotide-binding universal stress UspA family protein
MAEESRGDSVVGPIVVGVDGSAFSRAALRWAILEGRRWACPVIALMAWHVDPMIARSRPVVTGVPIHPNMSQEGVFRRFLDDTVRTVVRDAGGPAPSLALMSGLAADCLVEASDSARLLVLGSHGHGRFAGMVIGSVADHCVRNAACPVVVIPARFVDALPKRHPVLVPAALLPDRYGLGPL